MTAPDTPNDQEPTTRTDRWGLFLSIAAVIHFVGFVGAPNIVVPPKISQQLGKVLLGVASLFIPFIGSLFLLFLCRSKSERVISYGSLAASLLWLAVAEDLVERVLRGP
jgi:hypothetical protein